MNNPNYIRTNRLADMDVPVKKRTYDGSGRRTNSIANRRRILEAARSMFVEHGYRKTTVAMVAAAAGVSIDTVYELAGRKPTLLRELIEQSLSGTDRPVAAEQRPHVVAMRAEPDPVEKLALYTRGVRETHERLAPLFLALRDAATTDQSAAEVWQDISERRARNMRALVADVRSGDDEQHQFAAAGAADIVWALNSPELFHLLTVERGWPCSEYERFLRSALGHFVLD
jgi:AcrR family transcriptional regulator